MNNRGILICISGFSGSGKGTVVKRLLEKYPGEFALSISSTTRSPRPGEKDGESYFFRSREKFIKLIEEGEFLEYAEYVGNYYGTGRSFVEEKLSRGINVILEIEVQGALNVRQKMPGAVLLFMVPPSVEELERRLRERNTEDDATIRSRLEQARVEAESIDRYDYLILNDEIDKCVSRIRSVVDSVKVSTDVMSEEIKNIKIGLEEYLKKEGD